MGGQMARLPGLSTLIRMMDKVYHHGVIEDRTALILGTSCFSRSHTILHDAKRRIGKLHFAVRRENR
jgi:hypothetical protein